MNICRYTIYNIYSVNDGHINKVGIALRRWNYTAFHVRYYINTKSTKKERAREFSVVVKTVLFSVYNFNKDSVDLWPLSIQDAYIQKLQQSYFQKKKQKIKKNNDTKNDNFFPKTNSPKKPKQKEKHFTVKKPNGYFVRAALIVQFDIGLKFFFNFFLLYFGFRK